MTMNSESSIGDADDDKRTIGPSASNKDVLELLVQQGHYKTALGAFQAAAMLALRKGMDVSTAPPSAGTMWNRGSVSSQVLEFLTWYLPTRVPARALEQLGNLGTAYIAEKVKTGGYSVTEIFELSRMDFD
ncbi:hypothetical protein [Cryobacterium sp. TMT2-42-4]|uniref:hypothetical protein n=1 Tax=Cryobacterium sp. TMT2-42-4 TaxID=1259255 RepID=UPI00106CF945|nr:hypothetical protein [Cryobacterium sp. TMT2-42-4]TFC34131.1 hypothetical protein E3O18_12635 [Cryobacterium sp. TMT2-42-4]